jgi:uncharacterized protein (DUF58 family)
MFDSQRRTSDARRDELAPRLEGEREPRARVIREEKEGMFNEAWFWLAGLLTIVGAVTRETGFMALAACLATVIAVSWLWNRYSLRRLYYRRHFDRQRVFPGETIRMTIEVTNRKFLPLSWVRFRDEFPMAISPEGVTLSPAPSSESTGYLLSAFGLRWYERTRRQFRLQCQQRGHYFLGPVVAESGDVFTLFTSKEERLVRDPIIVYPQVYPLDELGFPSRAPFGEDRTRQSLIEDPTRTRGIRDYHPEDGFRHVHWKASARRAELQTRVYEPTSDMNLMVVLDVATMPKIWQGIRPDLLERAISVAASVADYAAERRWTLGLLSNGVPRSDQPIKVLPGRSPDQLAHILEALAAVTSFAAGSIEAILQVESPRIPLGATLVVVSAVENEELLATLIHLREAGRRIVLVSLADEEPPDDLPFLVYHLPAEVPTIWHRSAEKELDGTLAGIPVPQPVTTVSSP